MPRRMSTALREAGRHLVMRDVSSPDAHRHAEEMSSRPKLASEKRPTEIREFVFYTEAERYGMVNVGAKVCEVIPGSIASELGVEVGWYIAAVNGRELQGATVALCRTVPAATTDEVKAVLVQRRLECLMHGRPVQITFWTAPSALKVEYVDAPSVHAESLDEFKAILIEKYGSLVAAWTEHLDSDGSGEMDYQEFVQACRSIGFQGSLKKVYREMDKDGSGQISLNELDPHISADFSRGRCVVCTLPNPCDKHTDKEQKRYLMALRQTIMDGNPHGEQAPSGRAHGEVPQSAAAHAHARRGATLALANR